MIGRIMANLIVLYILVIEAMIVIGSESSDSRDAEINRLLKKLNKPFLKSIKVYLICGFTQKNTVNNTCF